MVRNSRHVLPESYPFADRFVLAVGKIFSILAALTVIVSVVYVFWVAWAFTSELRQLLQSRFWSVVVYLGAIAVLFLWGTLAQRLLIRYVMGRPVFGELGGLPIHTFLAAMRVRANIKIELDEHDRPLARTFNIIQIRSLHDTLKDNYQRLHSADGLPPNELEAKWAQKWSDDILNMPLEGQTFGEAADVNKFGINYAITALWRSTYMFPVIAALFWVVIVLIVYSYANQKLQLLTAIQAGLVLTFGLSAFWYMFVLHALTVFPLSFTGLPESTRAEYGEDIAKLEGIEIRPKKVEVGRRFYKLVRNYQLRLLSGAIFLDVSTLLLLLGATAGVTFLVDSAYGHTLAPYHATMAYGVLLGGLGLILSFYVFSLVLENSRKSLSALILAVLSAGLPFFIDYLLGGRLDISGVREAVFAGSGGLAVGLVTVITSSVKESIEQG